MVSRRSSSVPAARTKPVSSARARGIESAHAGYDRLNVSPGSSIPLHLIPKSRRKSPHFRPISPAAPTAPARPSVQRRSQAPAGLPGQGIIDAELVQHADDRPADSVASPVGAGQGRQQQIQPPL